MQISQYKSWWEMLIISSLYDQSVSMKRSKCCTTESTAVLNFDYHLLKSFRYRFEIWFRCYIHINLVTNRLFNLQLWTRGRYSMKLNQAEKGTCSSLTWQLGITSLELTPLIYNLRHLYVNCWRKKQSIFIKFCKARQNSGTEPCT